MDYIRQILSGILFRARALHLDAFSEPMRLQTLSVNTGISVSNLSKIFTNVQVPTATNLIKIIKALDCRLVVYCNTFPSFIEKSENFSNELCMLFPENENYFGYVDELNNFIKLSEINLCPQNSKKPL